MLKLDQIRFRHRKSDVAYDFSLTAAPGEVIGIMGASGSGKSTLLDLIAGFKTPESGTMEWGKTNLIPLPPEKRPITILFQHHNLFDHLSAARNVAVGINPARRISPDQQQAVHKALAEVDLSGKENQRASTLSGGQQQRVALARAIVRNRAILLLDEPFSGLDDTTKSDMLDLIRQQAVKDKKCVLMVTHDRSDCNAIADKTCKIDAGKLVRDE